MKKLIAFCTCIVTAVSLISSVNAYAEEYAAPTFYFGVESSQNVKVNGDTVTISRDAFNDSDFTLNVNVYIDDPDLKSWYVSPKWKCASEYITLSNLFLPNVENSEFAYGIIENNRLKYSVARGNDTDYNTMYFTCQTNNLSDRNPLEPLGDTSDAYPLTDFDAVISSDIPDGEYEIYFLTESEDYPDQQSSSGSFRMDDDTSKSYSNELIVRNLTVIIDSGSAPSTTTTSTTTSTTTTTTSTTTSTTTTPTSTTSSTTTTTSGNITTVSLGDVDNNDIVDVVDATLVLQQYSYQSMGNEGILTDEQINIGNVDGNTNADGTPLLDVVDATYILRYYSYFSMDNSFTWDDLFAM